MKKLIVLSLATLAVASAWAQGTFTIRRPADGARVRETISVRIPANSIPEGGYLGILVNGKFVEAVLPPVKGSDYVYELDSKKHALPDGETTIEAVLYMYTEGNPVVLNRSSVTVNLDNHTSINVPDGGRSLRYKFNPGREYNYKITASGSVAMVTQAQAQLGSRASEIPMGETSIRYMVGVDNRYKTASGYDGLIKVSALPDKGKDYVNAMVSGEDEPKKVYSHEMHPIYMRITDTGREIFGSAPFYSGIDGVSFPESRTDYFMILPLPVLPSRTVEKGDSWQAAITVGSIDLDVLHEQDKFVFNVPGRAVLEGFEWQDGHPCAKIRSTLKVGAKELVGLKGNSMIGSGGDAQSMELEQLYYYALDLGIIIKNQTQQTVETLVTVGGGNSGSFGSGTPGQAGGGLSAPGRGGGTAAAGVGVNRKHQFGDFFGVQSAYKFFQSAIGGSEAPGFRSGGGAPSGAGGSGGNTPGVKMIMRTRTIISMDLEQ